ncbi:hypothetical protein TYRP_008512 [Tyrophagus putrescentiae]|nr:hypothetical protein TYRP_008512 [Tyrophagus putrescentiae]
MGDNQLVLATKRIQRDLQAFNLDPTVQTMYSIELVNEENMFQLKGHINGPPDTLYHDTSGHICLNTLQKILENATAVTQPKVRYYKNAGHDESKNKTKR